MLGYIAKEPKMENGRYFEEMPSMGCADNPFEVFRWHFRLEGMALYPPKQASATPEEGLSSIRRRLVFHSKKAAIGWEAL